MVKRFELHYGLEGLGAVKMSGSVSSRSGIFSSALAEAYMQDVVAGTAHSEKIGTTTITMQGSPIRQRSEAVTVQLSPQASASLDQQQGTMSALQVAEILMRGMTAGGYKATVASAAQPAAHSAQSPAASPQTSGQTSGANDFETLLAQREAMSPSDRFYAGTDPTASSAAMAPDERAAYLAAFQSKTLRIQDAADVPGLDFSQSTTIEIGTGIGGTTSAHFNDGARVGFLQGASDGFIQVDPMMGGTVVTWS